MYKVTGFQNTVYALGIAGQNVLYNFMSIYIMFYFTDLLGIANESATAIVFIASIWDAVNDPAMGLIVDKTKTRIGKFRPYLIGGAPILFVTTVLCYSYFDTSPSVTVAIAAAAYVLWGMCYTVSDIPLWAITSVVSENPAEKNKIITIGKIGATMGAALCVLFSVTLLDAFGGTRSIDAYFYAALVVGGIAAVSVLAIGVFIKERIVPTSEKIGIRKNIQTVTKNKSLVLLLVALFVLNTINGIRQAVQIYFTTYAWGDEGYVTLVGVSLVVGTIVGMGVGPVLIKKYAKKKILMVSSLIGAAVNFLPYISLQNIPLGLISLGFSFASVGIMTITAMSMLLDSIDVSQRMLGFRGEGIVFSLNTFVTKLSGAFSRLLLGICLILMNYQENQPITETTINWFSALAYLVPAVASVATAVVIARYSTSE